jgi:hypothetical protein
LLGIFRSFWGFSGVFGMIKSFIFKVIKIRMNPPNNPKSFVEKVLSHHMASLYMTICVFQTLDKELTVTVVTVKKNGFENFQFCFNLSKTILLVPLPLKNTEKRIKNDPSLSFF